MSITYKVDGMTCGGCSSAVIKALEGLGEGISVNVDLETKAVTVNGLEDDGKIEQAIEDAGFDYLGRV